MDESAYVSHLEESSSWPAWRVPRAVGGTNGELLLSGHRISVAVMKNLETDSSNSCTALRMYQIPPNCTLERVKMANFMLYVFPTILNFFNAGKMRIVKEGLVVETTLDSCPLPHHSGAQLGPGRLHSQPGGSLHRDPCCLSSFLSPDIF